MIQVKGKNCKGVHFLIYVNWLAAFTKRWVHNSCSSQFGFCVSCWGIIAYKSCEYGGVNSVKNFQD